MTLCNLNIEMGGRSGFVAPDDSTFSWIAGRPFAPQGALWERALAHWRTLKTDDGAVFDREHVLDCSGARAADHLGHRSEPGARHFRPRARSVGRRPEPARRHGKRARLYGAHARHDARRPAGRSRVHRLLHQQPPARPAGRRRRGARAAGRGGRGRHGRAGLDQREARGRGRRTRPRLPRRRILLGRIRLLDVRRRQWRSRRAGRALRLHHQPQFRASPGPEGAHASRQPRDRRGDRHRRAHRRRAARHARPA